LERPAGEDDGGGKETTVSLTCGAEEAVGPDVSGALVGTWMGRKVVSQVLLGCWSLTVGPAGLWGANGSSRDGRPGEWGRRGDGGRSAGQPPPISSCSAVEFALIGCILIVFVQILSDTPYC